MTDSTETSPASPTVARTHFSLERQPLTLANGSDNSDALAAAPNSSSNQNDDDDEDDAALVPLFERVLQVIKSSSSSHRNANGSITIRPARLAAELGDVSVNEACAELCGLMAAIGGTGGDNGAAGATFTFEKLPTTSGSNNNHDKNINPDVMVFTFPPDFEKRARAHQRNDSLRQVLYETAIIGIKVVKIMTAFGLVLFLLILTVAAAVGIVAAILALSRGDRQQQHSCNMLIRQLHTLFYTIRQLLWCFAVFGPTSSNSEGDDEGNGGQDPFLREVAYDLFLVCSLCCGNPMSAFYWIRASQLSRRRRRAMYGWGGLRQRLSLGGNNNEMESSVPGVTLVRRGGWADDDDDLGSTSGNTAAAHRGLLSVAVEFLFGPTPFHPAPSEAQKWKLRAAVLVQQLSSLSSSLSSKQNPLLGVSMEEMSPYVDSPPALLPTNNDDKVAIQQLVSQTLKIVAHFNGIPVTSTGNNNIIMSQTRFVFPELLAESTVALQGGLVIDDEDDATWASLLYAKESNRTPAQRQRQQQQHDLPLYLHENRYKFTKLTGQQLLHCVGLGSLNAIGVVMLGQSLAPGGVLYMGDPKLLASTSWSWYMMHKMLLPVLRFYAALFFVLPAVRLLWIVIQNHLRQGRNRQRQALVKELLERQQSPSPAASASADTPLASTSPSMII